MAIHVLTICSDCSEEGEEEDVQWEGKKGPADSY